jgi:AcrR family transcriptional regulator
MTTRTTRNPTSKAHPLLRGRPPLDETERKRILDVTTAVFLETGFERASTNQIAQRAQTSKQTLYALFPTKADLFVGVISAHTERLFSRHMDYIESGKAPRQALTEMGYQILSMFSALEFQRLYRILVAEAHNFPDLSRQLWHECIERGYGLLAEYLRSRRLGGPGYRKSAKQFVSFVLGDFLISAMLNPDIKLSEHALRARVQKAVTDFLRLHPAPPSKKRG